MSPSALSAERNEAADGREEPAGRARGTERLEPTHRALRFEHAVLDGDPHRSRQVERALQQCEIGEVSQEWGRLHVIQAELQKHSIEPMPDGAVTKVIADEALHDAAGVVIRRVDYEKIEIAFPDGYASGALHDAHDFEQCNIGMRDMLQQTLRANRVKRLAGEWQVVHISEDELRLAIAPARSFARRGNHRRADVDADGASILPDISLQCPHVLPGTASDVDGGITGMQVHQLERAALDLLKEVRTAGSVEVANEVVRIRRAVDGIEFAPEGFGHAIAAIVV